MKTFYVTFAILILGFVPTIIESCSNEHKKENLYILHRVHEFTKDKHNAVICYATNNVDDIDSFDSIMKSIVSSYTKEEISKDMFGFTNILKEECKPDSNVKLDIACIWID